MDATCITSILKEDESSYRGYWRTFSCANGGTIICKCKWGIETNKRHLGRRYRTYQDSWIRQKCNPSSPSLLGASSSSTLLILSCRATPRAGCLLCWVGWYLWSCVLVLRQCAHLRTVSVVNSKVWEKNKQNRNGNCRGATRQCYKSKRRRGEEVHTRDRKFVINNDHVVISRQYLASYVFSLHQIPEQVFYSLLDGFETLLDVRLKDKNLPLINLTDCGSWLRLDF